MSGVIDGVASLNAVDVVVCPPFVYLAQVGKYLIASDIKLGAQDVCEHDSGAYTGEVSAPMLAELGCQFVIVGHSERRNLYGESSELVAGKFAAAQRSGMTPILCVGEQLEERENGNTEDVIARQLDSVLEQNGVTSLVHSVIAYEPVWAIGTGKTATPEQAADVHTFIRQLIAQHDTGIAEGLRIIYGGSVKASNAAALFAMPDLDGGLIGGAALKADQFVTICRCA